MEGAFISGLNSVHAKTHARSPSCVKDNRKDDAAAKILRPDMSPSGTLRCEEDASFATWDSTSRYQLDDPLSVTDVWNESSAGSTLQSLSAEALATFPSFHVDHEYAFPVGDDQIMMLPLGSYEYHTPVNSLDESEWCGPIAQTSDNDPWSQPNSASTSMRHSGSLDEGLTAPQLLSRVVSHGTLLPGSYSLPHSWNISERDAGRQHLPSVTANDSARTAAAFTQISKSQPHTLLWHDLFNESPVTPPSPAPLTPGIDEFLRDPSFIEAQAPTNFTSGSSLPADSLDTVVEHETISTTWLECSLCGTTTSSRFWASGEGQAKCNLCTLFSTFHGTGGFAAVAK